MTSHISLGIQDFRVCLTVETDLRKKKKKKKTRLPEVGQVC